jgi:HK97 family phage major capsid protein
MAAAGFATPGAEQRTGLSTADGAIGEFSPPAYLLDIYVRYARPSRVTANLCSGFGLGAGSGFATGMQVNVPKITAGSSINPQASGQNTSLGEVDPETDYLSTQLVTYGNNVTVSQQLLDRAGVEIDQVVFSDMVAASAAALDLGVLTGTGGTAGTGNQLNGFLEQSITTQSAPAGRTIAEAYGALAQAISTINQARFLPPDAIVVHSVRWYDWASQVDDDGRPVVVPHANGPMNAIGVYDSPSAEGLAGSIMGIPIYIDNQIPTGPDTVLVGRFSDAMLWETGPICRAFQQPYAANLSWLLQTYFYAAGPILRYPNAFVAITGWESPTYGS